MPSSVGMDQSEKSAGKISWLRETEGLLITAGADVGADRALLDVQR